MTGMPGPDEDLTTPEHLLHTGPAARLLQRLPGAVGGITQVIVDNPGQFALVTAASIVLTRAAVNLVRPRTAIEGLALLVLLQLLLPRLATAAVEHGWITFRIRTPDGRLVPLIIGKAVSEPVPAPDPAA